MSRVIKYSKRLFADLTTNTKESDGEDASQTSPKKIRENSTNVIAVPAAVRENEYAKIVETIYQAIFDALMLNSFIDEKEKTTREMGLPVPALLRIVLGYASPLTTRTILKIPPALDLRAELPLNCSAMELSQNASTRCHNICWADSKCETLAMIFAKAIFIASIASGNISRRLHLENFHVDITLFCAIDDVYYSASNHEIYRCDSGGSDNYTVMRRIPCLRSDVMDDSKEYKFNHISQISRAPHHPNGYLQIIERSGVNSTHFFLNPATRVLQKNTAFRIRGQVTSLHDFEDGEQWVQHAHGGFEYFGPYFQPKWINSLHCWNRMSLSPNGSAYFVINHYPYVEFYRCKRDLTDWRRVAVRDAASIVDNDDIVLESDEESEFLAVESLVGTNYPSADSNGAWRMLISANGQQLICFEAGGNRIHSIDLSIDEQ